MMDEVLDLVLVCNVKFVPICPTTPFEAWKLPEEADVIELGMERIVTGNCTSAVNELVPSATPPPNLV